jgi:hypothetical protein
METIQERFDRLDAMIAKGNVIRNAWTQGQERACLLAALSPEAGEQGTSEACPAFLLPQWFAALTPAMDDNGTYVKWPAFVKRYAAVVRNAALTLDTEGWRRAEYRVKAVVVRESMEHTTDETVLAACSTVVSLCERAINNDLPTEPEWSAAASAAYSAAESASYSAAESAAYSAANAVYRAAESAAWNAAWSAADAARNAADAARNAAYSATWDRFNTAILDVLEVEIKEAK